jgi:hypothetical protein
MDRHVYVWRPTRRPLPASRSRSSTARRWRRSTRSRTTSCRDGERPVGRAAGHEDRLDAGGRAAARRRQAGDRRRHERGVREAPNFASDGNGDDRSFISLGLLSQANGRVYAIPARGSLDPEGRANPAGPYLAGWPVRPAILAEELLPWIEGTPGSPVLADVDGDGELEVGIHTRRRTGVPLPRRRHVVLRTGAGGLPRTFPTDAATMGADTPTTEAWASIPRLGSGAFAPIGPGGDVVFVTPGAGFTRLVDAQLPAEQLPHDTHLIAYRATTGASLPAFPRLLDDLVFLGSPSIADVSGDDVPEILIGSGGYLVHAVDASGPTRRAGPSSPADGSSRRPP